MQGTEPERRELHREKTPENCIGSILRFSRVLISGFYVRKLT